MDSTSTSAGDNVLASPDSGCNLEPGIDVFGPLNLGVLSDNGGATRTMALDNGGAALDVGGVCPAVDQRGYARTDGKCDAGAFEL